MEQLIQSLEEEKYQPRTYVYATTDQLSKGRIQQLEQQCFPQSMAKVNIRRGRAGKALD
jgi:hypothetical protein